MIKTTKEPLGLALIKLILSVSLIISFGALIGAIGYSASHPINEPTAINGLSLNESAATLSPTPTAISDNNKLVTGIPNEGSADIVLPKAGVPAAAIVFKLSQPDSYAFCAILVGDEAQYAFYLANCDLDYFEQERDTEIYKGVDGYWRYKKDNAIIIAASECNFAPAQYIAPCKEFSLWLDKKISEWKPEKYKPMIFGAMNNAPMNSLANEFAEEYELGIEETGIDFVRTDIPKFSDTAKQSEAFANLGELVKSAQSRGKKVMIGNNVNGDREYYGTKSISWAEYSEKQKEYIRLAAGFGPDYLAVVLEPVVVVDPNVNKYRYLNFKETITPKMWGKLIKEEIDIIKTIDPDIKTAMGIIPQNQYEQEFFIEALKTKIDIVGADIYGTSGIEAMDKVLIPKWKEFGKEKEFWIMETWAGGIEFEGSVGQLWKKGLDGKWLKAMAYYSQQNGLKGMNVFYSKHFFTYDREVIYDLARFEEAIKNSRMPVFYVYKHLIEEIEKDLAK